MSQLLGTVGIYTLGCKVNQYESQALCEKFAARGHQIVSHNQNADVYVINSCTVNNIPLWDVVKKDGLISAKTTAIPVS